ncbi:MAG TPA: beta-N-acetylhexosaminidase [bacterium]
MWKSLCFCLVLVNSVQGASKSEILILPQPRETEARSGTFRFDRGEVTILLSASADSSLWFAARQLQTEIETAIKTQVAIAASGNADRAIMLGIPERDDRIKAALQKANLSCDADLGMEGYVLQVSPEHILVAANEGAGVFYGVQSLKQILRGQRGKPAIPCLRIRDWPMLSIRGIQDDISRGPIPTKEFFKEEIRRFAELKLNTLVYYNENMIRTEKHGVFTPPAALTLEEVRELIAYARQHHLELLGVFQSFGHFEKILEYPQYERFGEQGSLLSPAFPESYQLLSEIYAELAPLFPSKHFVALCDEVWALGKGASRMMVEEKGLVKVYADHIDWVQRELAKYGKRAWIAADVVLAHPEILAALNKDIILLPWNYSPRQSFVDMIAPLREHGFEVVVLPGVSCSRRFFPDHLASVTNIRNFVRDGIAHNALGVLNTTWDDGGANFYSSNWYGIAFGADQSWHSENFATAGFDHRFAETFYGDSSGAVAEAIRSVSSLSRFPEMQNLEYSIFWQRLVPEYGEKSQIRTDDWAEIKSIAENAGQSLQRSSATRYSGDLDYVRFAADQVIFMADARRTLLSSAEQYRLACLSQPNREVVKRTLDAARSGISDLKVRWDQLADRYQQLWLRENQPYWLNNIQRKFKAIADDFADAETRLQQAAADLEAGHFLPPPARVRLDIRELSEDFFQSWLLCGSFPNPKKELGLSSHEPGGCVGFDTDYLTASGGERGVQPRADEMVTRPDGSTVAWKVHTSTTAEVDLQNLFDQNSRTVAYAFASIESQKEQTVTAGFGSNDGIKIFLNGDQVFETHSLRFVQVDGDTVRLNLKKGTNRLLLKIDQGRGLWGFVFRFLETPVRNHSFKYTVLDN